MTALIEFDDSTELKVNTFQLQGSHALSHKSEELPMAPGELSAHEPFEMSNLRKAGSLDGSRVIRFVSFYERDEILEHAFPFFR